jgi:AcrR family transcriptional regulator/DNA-binding MarR family transcriptional regulator
MNTRAALASPAGRSRPACRPGSHRAPLSRQVARVQRARILAAMLEVACEEGLAVATVGRVIARARVSRRTFYELFSNCDDCLLAVFDETVERATARVSAAYESDARWVDRLRSALFELFAFVEEEPDLARVCLSYSCSGEPHVAARRARILAQLASALAQGREAGEQWPPALTDELAVGAICAALATWLQGASTDPLCHVLPQVMALVVLPYRGRAAARRELLRPGPAPAPRSDAEVTAGCDEVLVRHTSRLTHRTITVLDAIARNPYSSNREVARAAGVRDQGQISKLLARLRAAELVETHADGPRRHARNAWVLTATGAHVHEVIAREVPRHLWGGGEEVQPNGTRAT